jgi:HEAT repeat protein
VDLVELSDDENMTEALAATVARGGCLHSRISAATALAEMNGLPDELTGDLHADCPDARTLACVAHAAGRDGELDHLVEVALRDPDLRVREAAVEALCSHPDGDDGLREIAEDGDDRIVVLHAVRALGSHAARACDALVALVEHPDVEVGLAAFAALGRAPGGARASAARRLLDRSDERARILALVALADVGAPNDLGLVEPHLGSETARVRSAALEARASLAIL